MKRIWLRTTMLLLSSVAAVATVAAAAASSDESAIRAVEARQAAAWNHHDAAEYAALFTSDGDVVNVLGWWWHGPAEIKTKLTGAFAWVFRDSTLTIDDVSVRLLDARTAVVHVRWSMDGAKAPPGAPTPPRQGIQLQVLRKIAGKWLISSFQNTNSAPESPFPPGPPPAPVAPMAPASPNPPGSPTP